MDQKENKDSQIVVQTHDIQVEADSQQQSLEAPKQRTVI